MNELPEVPWLSSVCARADLEALPEPDELADFLFLLLLPEAASAVPGPLDLSAFGVASCAWLDISSSASDPLLWQSAWLLLLKCASRVQSVVSSLSSSAAWGASPEADSPVSVVDWPYPLAFPISRKTAGEKEHEMSGSIPELEPSVSVESPSSPDCCQPLVMLSESASRAVEDSASKVAKFTPYSTIADARYCGQYDPRW